MRFSSLKNERGHNPGAPALLLDNVRFAYPGVLALDTVSFSAVSPGLTAVIGPNGGGKTTLLKLILGLLAPQQGRVEVFGARPHRACSRVGYVPQHITLQPDFPITVSEVVGMGCGHKRSAVEAALEQAGLSGLSARPFDALSGGQRQRVLIARALSGDPGLLLLDEPTSGVDPGFTEQLRELIFDLAQNRSVVVVSHNLSFVEPRTEQTIFLDRTARTLSQDEMHSDLLWSLYSRSGGVTS
jgi:zinc transport system ATP-binding protein